MQTNNVLTAAFGAKSLPELMTQREHLVAELQKTQKERVCVGMVDGVQTETRPFYTDRRHDRATVHLGPEMEQFACEWTAIPWNIFKEITVNYWVWIDVDSKTRASEILEQAKVNGRIEPDPYAEPERFHVWVDTLEDVVKIWKTLKRK